MPKTGAGNLAGPFQEALTAAFSRMDDGATFRLRSELSAMRAVVAGGKDKDLLASVDRALEAVGRFHAFASEVKGFVLSRDFSAKASLYDIGSIGILAVENILTADRVSLFRLLMSGLSEGLAFLASRQYIYGSTAVLESLYRTHSATMYEELWSLATEFRGPLDEAAAREIQAGIDSFFKGLSSPGVKVDDRVAALYQLYGILVLLRCGDLLQRLK
ncbi:MAG: hypothetical protein A3K65_02490 [Euryarchaeota archaeon RBG_16_68_12]|nr:MAG: hypothetical protein A3K65_02490 [Euryarchaeota archaeon RBG_16_68_12]